MAGPFDYFVVFAEMRTGSNYLETNLNAFEGLRCHGEAFNPHFIGYPNRTHLLGLTQAQRDANPETLIEAVRAEAGALAGFRFFHDHDARVRDIVLNDPRCAKIVLTRNPLDSYVSWKIARETGQWKLTDVKRRKEARVAFDAGEFSRHVQALQDFQVELMNRLQTSGQTAFYIDYEDLRSVEVMNGLARWLGLDEALDSLDNSLKPQNPAPVLSKVRNPEALQEGLAEIDRFNLGRTPNFEPRRGPVVPSYIAAATAPLLFMPVPGAPEAEIVAWLTELDGVDIDALTTRANQRSLRRWKRNHPGHRSFTVLRHPALRAHDVFCKRILPTGSGGFRQIRETLRRQFKLPIPKKNAGDSYDKATHRAAFEGFLGFVKSSIAGQTSLRVDPAWASQSTILAGFAEFALPDHILREEEINRTLPALAAEVGRSPVSAPIALPETGPFVLADIYDTDLEALVADVYQRDYLAFGFGPWQNPQDRQMSAGETGAVAGASADHAT